MLAYVLCGLQTAEAASASSSNLISMEAIDRPPAGASAWRITYGSVAENGPKVTISGFVIVPNTPAPAKGRKIVAWGHSTVGIAEACAPSTSPTRFSDIAGLDGMIANGYVVVASDLQGLGTPGPQPYLVGVSSGRAILDSVRAVAGVPHADAGKRVVLSGVSQGAHAALWAAQLAQSYAPELSVIGVAAAAAPTDLVANFAAIGNPFVRSLMTGYVSKAWSEIYGIPLSTFANPIGRFFIRRLARDCLRLDSVTAASDTGLLILSHAVPDHLGDPWTKPLHDNSAKPMRFDMPILIVQGLKDTVVIAKVTDAYVAASCRAGNDIRYLRVPDGTHTNIGTESVGATVRWITDRFDGKAPTSDCDHLVR